MERLGLSSDSHDLLGLLLQLTVNSPRRRGRPGHPARVGAHVMEYSSKSMELRLDPILAEEPVVNGRMRCGKC